MRSMKTLTCLMLCAALLVGAATSCRHYTPVRTETPYPHKVTPVAEERVITISGEALALPMNALPPAPLSGARVGETELAKLAQTPGAQMLMRPKMRVTENTTGRFKLGIEGEAATPQQQLTLELTPRIPAQGQLALEARIETQGSDGMKDSISRDRAFQANAGEYGIFGPVRMDKKNVYVLLKGDVER